MTPDRDRTLQQIRRRDAMYQTAELTQGPVLDRRTLLHIIDELQQEIAEYRAENEATPLSNWIPEEVLSRFQGRA